MDTSAAVSGDRFEMLGELGTGGMGVVYRVFDRLRGREVALKALRAAGPQALYRFKREFRELCELAHPNLVALHELYVVGEEWMFTMELVDGVRFKDWVGGDEHRLREALVQLADGLTALHAAGKLHRDVKPSNVLVTGDGRLVLLDFGLVRDQMGPERTHEGIALGTPAYMSPEQAADVELTPATDWYAVGVMLYEALCGLKPFRGASTMIMVDKQTKDPPPPSTFGPVAADLEALCMRLLARDPRARPDGAAVLAALGAAPSLWTRRIADRASPELVAADRHAELAILHQALADSRQGPVVVLVNGPRGVGRSALLDTFAGQLLAAGEAVVFPVRVNWREDIPLRGLDALVDSVTRYLTSLPPDEAAALLPRDLGGLARMFPTVKRLRATWHPDLPGPVWSPQQLTTRAFTAVGEMLSAIAATRPVAILLDDSQWGATESSGAAQAVLKGPNAPAMLLVLTYPDDRATVPAVVRWLELPGTIRITLAPITI